jgi:predicted SAM-dependent methyltransferase
VLAPFHRRRGWTEPYSERRDGRTWLRPRRGARIHLGCGDIYLSEYLNVDYPPELGVASGTSRPDVEADIVSLDCPPDAVAEIRLHHVFEHFERAVALALLVRWYEWLSPGGVLTIETPDF